MNRSTLMILLFGALLLTGLFLLMRPVQEPVTASLDLPARIVDFAVTDGRLAEGPAVVSVTEGTPVTLRFVANQEDEAHLHGYDLSAELKPGQRSEITFVASISGRFEIELHKSHAKLAVLEVQPH